MIEFKETRDWRDVWSLTDTECDITRLFDDARGGSRGVMKRRIQHMVEDANNHAYRIIYNGAVAGCFMMYALSAGTYEVHITLKRNYRGLRGIKIGRAGTSFALSQPHVFQLVSFVPATLRESLYYALQCGWQSLGVLPGKWIKNGVEYAMTGVVARKGGI